MRWSTGTDGRNGRSFGDLLRDLRDDTVRLFRCEAALARREIRENLSRMARHADIVVIGVCVGIAAATALTAAAVIALAALLHIWLDWILSAALAALIVGLTLAGASRILIRTGRRRLADDPIVPQRTAQSLKEHQEWITERFT